MLQWPEKNITRMFSQNSEKLKEHCKKNSGISYFSVTVFKYYFLLIMFKKIYKMPDGKKQPFKTF